LTQSSELLDTAYSLETPDGVDLQVDLAGPIVRTLAFCIDFSIRFAVMLGIVIVSSIMGDKIGWAVTMLSFFIIEWWYPVLFEVFRKGQTPGKRAMGIQVLQDDLTPVSFSASFIRNLLRFVDFLPSFYTFAYVCMVCHPQMKRLGDIAGGTVVVHCEKNTGYSAQDIDEAPILPPFELEEDEQSAIVEFALRNETLSESRQKELADIVNDTFSLKSDSVEFLRGIGAWLVGKRR